MNSSRRTMLVLGTGLLGWLFLRCSVTMANGKSVSPPPGPGTNPRPLPSPSPQYDGDRRKPSPVAGGDDDPPEKTARDPRKQGDGEGRPTGESPRRGPVIRP